jgi:aerobic-type carbon monoxide dehydrogenase small subunit (CoxS/CutS family)
MATFMPSFFFNDDEIDFQAGDTIASALLRSGNLELRRTRFKNEPRSLFCGIGQCFDCVVVIDEIPNQRSCITLAKLGMKIRTQMGSK